MPARARFFRHAFDDARRADCRRKRRCHRQGHVDGDARRSDPRRLGRPRRQGPLSITLGALTASATGTVANQIFHGTLTATLAPLVLFVGRPDRQRQRVDRVGNLTASALGHRQQSNLRRIPLDDARGADWRSQRPGADQGSVSNALAALALSRRARCAISSSPAGSHRRWRAVAVVCRWRRADGSSSITLGAPTASATGGVLIKGSSATALGALALDADGTVANQVFHGTLATMLAALTASAVGSVRQGQRHRHAHSARPRRHRRGRQSNLHSRAGRRRSVRSRSQASPI